MPGLTANTLDRVCHLLPSGVHQRATSGFLGCRDFHCAIAAVGIDVARSLSQVSSIKLYLPLLRSLVACDVPVSAMTALDCEPMRARGVEHGYHAQCFLACLMSIESR